MILTRCNSKEIKLDDLIHALQPRHVQGILHETINGLTYDSRLVRPGYLFATIRGAHQNGVDYVEDALQRGAIAVLSEYDFSLPRGITLIQVDDVRKALAATANIFYRNPTRNLETYGTTGTNGKTSVSYLIQALLVGSGHSCGLIGTIEHVIGERRIPALRTTPEAPELQAMLAKMVDVGCRSVAMEVSSHALIQQRILGIAFDVVIFTNLSQDHLDYHKNMERYFKAKVKLFTEYQNFAPHQIAVINTDDEYGQRLANHPERCGKLITYGLKNGAMVRASNILLNRSGACFDLSTPWGKERVNIPFLGLFNISNALAAIAACAARGIPLEEICRTLQHIQAPPGRLERIPSKTGYIYVDYAHTAQALKNVLSTLRNTHKGKINVLFGCGGNRDWEKRIHMAQVAEQYADYIIVTTDNPRSEDPVRIARDICSGFSAQALFQTILDREVAIAEGISKLNSDDVLLIAGKGHEAYIEYENCVKSFDDRLTAKKILECIEGLPDTI